MLGVDFVISALFETSGFRCEGDCARPLPELITSKTKATKKKLINFTAGILLRGGESESANHVRHSWVFSRPLPVPQAIAVLSDGALIS